MQTQTAVYKGGGTLLIKGYRLLAQESLELEPSVGCLYSGSTRKEATLNAIQGCDVETG